MDTAIKLDSSSVGVFMRQLLIGGTLGGVNSLGVISGPPWARPPRPPPFSQGASQQRSAPAQLQSAPAAGCAHKKTSPARARPAGHTNPGAG